MTRASPVFGETKGPRRSATDGQLAFFFLPGRALRVLRKRRALCAPARSLAWSGYILGARAIISADFGGFAWQEGPSL